MEKNKLISVLKKIGFKETLGYYSKNNYKVSLDEDFIICHKDFELLFQIKSNVALATLLVMFQEYQIFHDRYCYERLEAIEEDFEDDDYEEDE